MKLQAFLVLAALSLGAPALGAAPYAVAPAMRDGSVDDGLVAVHSRNLDRFYALPNANLRSYRRVIIDPPQVEFDREWLRDMNDTRHVYRLRPEDVQRIRDETAAGMDGILAGAFRAAGYEVATAPGPGVLRLSPRIADLYVNAPDILPPGRTRSFSREAGDATLILEARDAVSGTLLVRTVDRRTAREVTHRFTRATMASNNFWFDTTFKRWAAAVAREFERTANRPAAQAPAT